MRYLQHWFAYALFAAVSAIPLVADSLNGKDQPDGTLSQKKFADALILRENAAAAVANGLEKPTAALKRLKALGSLSGIPMDIDADYAFAIVEVGQRILALGKPVEAEVFFVEAEKTLGALLAKTADTEAQNKAMCLQELGFIRAHYLNEVSQAEKDFEQAIELQPNDSLLRRSRDSLLNEHAELDVPKSPKN